MKCGSRAHINKHTDTYFYIHTNKYVHICIYVHTYIHDYKKNTRKTTKPAKKKLVKEKSTKEVEEQA